MPYLDFGVGGVTDRCAFERAVQVTIIRVLVIVGTLRLKDRICRPQTIQFYFAR